MPGWLRGRPGLRWEFGACGDLGPTESAGAFKMPDILKLHALDPTEHPGQRSRLTARQRIPTVRAIDLERLP